MMDSAVYSRNWTIATIAGSLVGLVFVIFLASWFLFVHDAPYSCAEGQHPVVLIDEVWCSPNGINN